MGAVLKLRPGPSPQVVGAVSVLGLDSSHAQAQVPVCSLQSPGARVHPLWVPLLRCPRTPAARRHTLPVSSSTSSAPVRLLSSLPGRPRGHCHLPAPFTVTYKSWFLLPGEILSSVICPLVLAIWSSVTSASHMALNVFF